MNVLHKIDHKGLGDNVMFTAVLPHLEKHHPDWDNYILTQPARVSLFDKGVSDESGEYDKVIYYIWFDGATRTPAYRCLDSKLNIEPEWDLLKYKVNYSDITFDYPSPFAVLHYCGHSYCTKKNLRHKDIKEICRWLIDRKITPVIIDFDHESNFIDNKTTFRYGGHRGESYKYIYPPASNICSLMQKAVLTLTIDSGPGKLAYCVDTPNITVWREMHPLLYVDNVSNAVHLVPNHHRWLLNVNVEQSLDFFHTHYNYVEYQSEIPRAVIEQMEIIINKKTHG